MKLYKFLQHDRVKIHLYIAKFWEISDFYKHAKHWGKVEKNFQTMKFWDFINWVPEIRLIQSKSKISAKLKKVKHAKHWGKVEVGNLISSITSYWLILAHMVPYTFLFHLIKAFQQCIIWHGSDEKNFIHPVKRTLPQCLIHA